MPCTKPRYVLILAAGKGTRMGSATQHKVCFLVDGRPVINRVIEIYRASGIAYPIVVVGALASQVMQTIAQEHSGIIYAYQAEQRGTGDAARIGLRALDSVLLDGDADLLLVAGDRIVEQQVLEQLYELYYASACDLAFVSTSRSLESEQGRVVVNGAGQTLGVVEMRDVWQREAYLALRQKLAAGQPPTRAEATALLQEHTPADKVQVTFNDLWTRLQTAEELSRQEWNELLDGKPDSFMFKTANAGNVSMSPQQVAQITQVNVSVYLLRASALQYALDHLSTDNAQHEEYLSDVVNILVQAGRSVRTLYVQDSRRVLGYNNPAELLAVEAYYRAKKQAALVITRPTEHFWPVSRWLDALTPVGRSGVNSSLSTSLANEFTHAYGSDQLLLNERRRALTELLHFCWRHSTGDPQVAVVRSPGRANILGRHIDHQGGICNLLAIDREILAVVHPRRDDIITLHNVNGGEFKETQFSIAELVSLLPWDDWMSLVNSPAVLEMSRSAHGDWSQYVKAAVLRLQKHYRDRALNGMDLYVHGNIPIAAGLSSSSALVVATLEAMSAVNRLDIQPEQFIDLAGEGEWFVGTRGGSADHAAIKYGQRGKVAQVTFFPFGVKRLVDFPPGYHLVVCDSRIQARKSQEAREIFNQRIACYRAGLLLIKHNYPQYAPLLEHLRDVNVRNLRIPLSSLYQILLSLPISISREELADSLPASELASVLAALGTSTYPLPVRGVVLFGLAECERSRYGVELLASGQVQSFGELMKISHNGDRVVAHTQDGAEAPYQAPISDAYLQALIDDSASGDLLRSERARLELQPGSYRCSTREIDWMVDIARNIPQVAGAQLAGAGLGGCMMVLAHASAINALVDELTRRYYAPHTIEPGISVCVPIAGSSILALIDRAAH
ncbi:MAG: NTP transferase domain-containing protein [Chloroflexi bacterium]|nr:NTP transferase domain-containing protein [Chloroflexota bacterium]